MNIGVHRFFWMGVSGFLGYNPSNGLAGSKAAPFLVFWGNSILFSTVAAPVCIPTNCVLGFPFLHNLTSTCLLICLWWSFRLVWNGISLWLYFIFIFCIVQVQLFPVLPYHIPHPTHPHLPPSNLPPLALSMGPLYMFLDGPPPIIPQLSLSPLLSGYCQFVHFHVSGCILLV